ncbi:MAG TPA: hypothetical protein PK781_08690 [Terrimesophilobacter sp.]|nr:hypothetical protein [Terrimesophilobacter sp.]HRQ00522.1 hypothetical protein [Terrimesophilobacter sp.]
MTESKSTPAPKARKTAAKSAKTTADVTPGTPAEAASDAANNTAEAVEAATADAQGAVETITVDSDSAVANAADSAAETVADAANEAAAEAAAATAATDTAATDTAVAVTADADATPVRTIYVTAPTPPAKKGNRVLGILIALLAAGVFAALYAGAFAVVRILQGASPAADLPGFLGSASFIFPVAITFVVFMLWALLVNRAGWWTWILGSFIVGAAVYAGTIGLAALIYQVQIPWTDPVVIVSAVLAREVTVWLGGILSARGKRLKARNAEARAKFDQEEAERRAERERHA